MSNATEEEIRGVAEVIHFARPGFSAGKLYGGGRRTSFSVKGFVKQGQPVTIRGQWENHPKFGRQFKGSEVVFTMPADVEGIEAWLKTYAEGMGPAKAKQAVAEFGIDFPRVLAQDPEQVAVELRLPIEFVHRLAAKWVSSASEVNAMATLLRHGLTQTEAETLYERYKGSAVAILEENPYSLLGQVPGFGWAKIDAIGGKFGIEPGDPRRLRASLVEVLRIEFGQGSTCVGDGLIAEAADLCGAMFVESGQLEAELAEAIREGRIIDLDGAHGLPRPVQVERWLARHFADMNRKNGYFRTPTDAEIERLRELPTASGTVTLDDTQLAAVRCAIENRGCAITGGAGAGKTLIAKAIVRQYEAADLEFALCAPTGKAAKRLGSVLGRDASTIHRLLGYNPETGGFLHDAGNLLPFDLVLVDEVSMADAELLWALLQAIRPGAAIVLIGDPNQLPPVGAGYPLRDILAHDLIPSVRLGHCHRQAGILAANCNAILDGKLEPTDAEGEPPAWIKKDTFHEPGLTLAGILFLVSGNANAGAKLDEWGYGDPFAHQFMTAKHDGQLGTKAINELLQRLHQKKLGVELPLRDSTSERLPLLVGDKVIQTVNNYQTGVMNGTLGLVTDDAPLTIDFEGVPVVLAKEQAGQVSLAYCLTPHKMQGSQVPCAIVICPRQHGFMQNRSWLYTAVTRAQKTAIVMGDSTGCAAAVRNREVDRRTTVLKHLAMREDCDGR